MHVDTISERYGVLLEAFLRAAGPYRQELLQQVFTILPLFFTKKAQLTEGA